MNNRKIKTKYLLYPLVAYSIRGVLIQEDQKNHNMTDAYLSQEALCGI